MEEKHSMKFRSKGDYLAFAWVIILVCVVVSGTIITKNYLAYLFFFIGMYSTLVLLLWIKRNKEMWKESMSIKCTFCGSCDTIKYGWYYGLTTKQKYKCKNCKKVFY